MYNNRPPIFTNEKNSYKKSYEDKLKEVDTALLIVTFKKLKARVARHKYEKCALSWRAYNIVRQILERRYHLC